MNSLQWMALYCGLVAAYAMYKIGDIQYRFWILELDQKAARFAEMCETIYDREMYDAE